MEAFYRDQLNFTADSFDTFCKWVATLMSNVDKERKGKIEDRIRYEWIYYFAKIRSIHIY